MKPQEVRVLEMDELDGKLKSSRRELYELRFKLAVGQLDDHRQIRKVRSDIARLLTFKHQRELGLLRSAPEAEAEVTTSEPAVVAVAEAPATEPEAEPDAEPAVEPEAELAAEPEAELAAEPEAELAAEPEANEEQE
jgi:large subunit ribosomal protein L29